MEVASARKTDRFFSSFTPISYKKGDILLRTEDPPPGVYYLKKGLVRQYILSPAGGVFVVHIYRPGSFFPLMWAINDIPNGFYFEALEATEVRRAPKEKVVEFLRKHPDVLYDTLQRIISGLHGFVTRTAQLVLDDAYTKTALLLLYLIREFGQPTEGGVALKVPLVHREIAAWIGTTRETASLQVEALKRKGILTNRGRQLIVPDIEILEKEIAASRGID